MSLQMGSVKQRQSWVESRGAGEEHWGPEYRGRGLALPCVRPVPHPHVS
jgi:hypothetical protein